MTAYLVNVFGGMSPMVSDRLLPPSFAKRAVNTVLNSGELVPLRAPLKVGNNLLSKAGVKLSLYRFGQDVTDETQFWFHWTTNVNVVRGNLAEDTTERTYFTGDGVPKVTYSPIAVTGGGTDYPYATFNLGVIRPDLITMSLSVANRTIVSITRTGTTATATTELPHKLQSGSKASMFGAADALYNGSFTVTVITPTQYSYTMTATPAANATGTLTMNFGGLPESRVYAISYQSALGEEGAPAISSGFLSVIAGQIVTIAGLPAAPAGAYNFTKKNIYRTASGSVQGSLRFVGSATLAAASFVDEILSTELKGNIETLAFEAPPADMTGLIAFSNGMMAGISGNQVCICEPFRPHAYPIANRYSISNVKPVALGSFDQTIVVLTNGVPSVLQGSAPLQMTEATIQESYPCTSAQSVISMTGGVIWATEQGLAYYSTGGAILITKERFTTREWALYAPKTMRAYRWQNRYVAFYNTGLVQRGFVFDVTTMDFYELDFYATAGYTDPKNGNLYLAIGNDVFKFDGGADLKQTWASKRFVANKLINMAVAKVVAKDYPVTFKLYADDNLKFTKQVQDRRIFTLPGGYNATDFEVELSGKKVIQGFGIAESVAELKAAVE